MTTIFTNPDLRSLCDTCLLFATLKKYIIYKLNKEYSLMYYDDILFRNNILHKIFNPYKQLKLDLSDCQNITNLSVLDNIYSLNLS